MFPLFQKLTKKNNSTVVKWVLVPLFFLGLSACDFRSFFGNDFEGGRPIQTNAFNYTPYSFIDITYQDAAEPPNILKASFGGSAYAREGDRTELGSGLFVYSEQMICCLNWKRGRTTEIALRVRWLAVYDLPTYERESLRKDERLVEGSIAGSQWCEAFVRIAQPYLLDPDVLSVHFLPDGTLEAFVGKYGDTRGIGHLPVSTVLAHTTPTSPVLCRNPISNPFYKIPRPPHRE